jgi:hypothetical protein
LGIVALGCEDVAEESVFVGDERGFEGCLGGFGVFEGDGSHCWFVRCPLSSFEGIGKFVVVFYLVADEVVMFRVSIRIQGRTEQDTRNLRHIYHFSKNIQCQRQRHSYPSPTT